MFCLKCGEVIPNNVDVCPKCGASVKENNGSDQAVVYASPKEPEQDISVVQTNVLGKKYLIWSALAVISFIILTQKYFSVSIKIFYSSSDATYTGYGLIECIHGSVGLSAKMIIALIIIDVAVIITGILGMKEAIKKSIIKGIMIIESIGSLVVTIITYFNIKEVLKEFDSSLSTTDIGMGCYLSIILSVVMIIMYFAVYSKELSE